MIRRKTCLLCNRELFPIPGSLGYQRHPPLEDDERDCLVEITDAWGVAVDGYEQADPLIVKPTEEGGFVIDLNPFPLVDDVLKEIFEERGLKRLGGASSGRGWTSFSIYQRCPYAWKRRYIDSSEPQIAMRVESPSRAIGSLIHTYLALYYENMLVDSPYRGFTPEIAHEMIVRRANPELVLEAWRVFVAYVVYYQHEKIIPLAVEHDLKDPRTGESCRFDLIAYFPEDQSGLKAGTYNIEHKSYGRFDKQALDGWANDGEVLGQVALWDALKLEKRFGPMKATIVNILGKQKEPKFHRTIVAPETWQIEQHLNDLKFWEGMISNSRATGIFPRARTGCITRWGFCDYWNHCAGVDDFAGDPTGDGA